MDYWGRHSAVGALKSILLLTCPENKKGSPLPSHLILTINCSFWNNFTGHLQNQRVAVSPNPASPHNHTLCNLRIIMETKKQTLGLTNLQTWFQLSLLLNLVASSSSFSQPQHVAISSLTDSVTLSSLFLTIQPGHITLGGHQRYSDIRMRRR